MKTILFDIFPAQSHINCTLKMANLLKQAGHRVAYLGVKEYEELIVKSGFEYFVKNPFILTPISVLRSQSRGRFLLENIMSAFNKSRLAEAEAGFRDLDELISELRPDAVLLDIHKSILKAPFYQMHHIPVIAIHTTFDVKRMPNVPPITSYYIPKESTFSHLYTALLFFFARHRNLVQFEWSGIKYLWQGDYSVIRNFYREHGIQLKRLLDLNLSLGFSIKGLPRLILAPTPLDFQTPTRENTYCIGPLINTNREGIITDVRYNSLIGRIKQEKASQYAFIVYCSMGTLAGLAKAKTNRFFKRMAKVARLNPNYLIILSTGVYFNVNELLPTPVNLLHLKRYHK